MDTRLPSSNWLPERISKTCKSRRHRWYASKNALSNACPSGTLINIDNSRPQADIGDLIMLTCPAPADSGFDIYSRVFAPAFGVPEDPVVRSPTPAARRGDSTQVMVHPRCGIG